MGGLLISKTKVAILIDGGHLRARSKIEKRGYTPDLIEKVAMACVIHDEELLRVLYYDCAPHTGTTKLPVSGKSHEFKGSDGWLKQLAAKDLFAVRRGVLKFRGWKPKKTPLGGPPLKDEDFEPYFEQKGVDMRIGLDMATFAELGTVDRIILITNDTDCVPAMKHVRKAGLQVVLVCLGKATMASELLWHTDFARQVNWPA